MRLSNILNDMNYQESYSIKDESDFDTLGLVAASVDKSLCTFLENKKYIKNIPVNANMVIITEDIYNNCTLDSRYGVCITKNPKIMFFKIHNYLKNSEEYRNKRFETIVGNNCVISERAVVSKYNVIIGDNCIIEDNSIINENTVIGNDVVIRSGCIISREGFEFKNDGEINFHVVHLGSVVIEDNVEIQDLTCIDRAIYPWDTTFIGKNSKIDCLCQVGHGAKIGQNALIAGSNTIGGRSIIGDNLVTGGRVSIMHGGLKIGNNVFIGIGSVVLRNIKDGERVFGNPAKSI